MTKNVNISGSTQSFFTEQKPLDLQLDNKLYQQIVVVFSNDFKNGPESLTLMFKLMLPCRVNSLVSSLGQATPSFSMLHAEKLKGLRK